MSGNSTHDVFRLDAGRKRPASAERVRTRLVVTDGRTTQARRFKSLCEAFCDQAGGVEKLTPSTEQLIRQLAVVTLQAEELANASASGTAINPELFISTISNQRRLLKLFADLTAPPKEAKHPGKQPKRSILPLPEVKPPAFHEVVAQVIAAREKDVAP